MNKFQAVIHLEKLKFNRFLPSPSSLPSAILDCLLDSGNLNSYIWSLIERMWYNERQKYFDAIRYSGLEINNSLEVMLRTKGSKRRAKAERDWGT